MGEAKAKAPPRKKCCSRLGSWAATKSLATLAPHQNHLTFPLLFSLPSSSSLLASASLDGEILYVQLLPIVNLVSASIKSHLQGFQLGFLFDTLAGLLCLSAKESPELTTKPRAQSFFPSPKYIRPALFESESVRRAIFPHRRHHSVAVLEASLNVLATYFRFQLRPGFPSKPSKWSSKFTLPSVRTFYAQL